MGCVSSQIFDAITFVDRIKDLMNHCVNPWRGRRPERVGTIEFGEWEFELEILFLDNSTGKLAYHDVFL